VVKDSKLSKKELVELFINYIYKHLVFKFNLL